MKTGDENGMSMLTNLLSIVALLMFSQCALAFTEEQLKWLESEEEHPTAQVNEGALTFLPTTQETEHLHDNQLWIDQGTIASGWARLRQCHTSLDAVPRLDIVYHPDRIRDLKVISSNSIASAVATGHTIELQDIEPGAEICISATSRVFHPVESTQDGMRYELVNGPFMRQFLDGFYPLQVRIQVNYPQDLLKLVSVSPESQSGWNLRYDAGRIEMQGRFEGKLTTRLIFEKLQE